MAAKIPAESPTSQEPKDAIRATYIQLFYEMQFRGTKNALMNYLEADALEEKGQVMSFTTNVLTGLSASGLLASLIQKGKSLMGSKAGLAGVVGLPVCGLAQVLNNSTSEFMPSCTERARKHVAASAGWNFVSESARAARLRMLADPEFDLNQAKDLYDELLRKREEISKLVLVSSKTSHEFTINSEQVFLAMKKRNEAFTEFEKLDKQQNYSASDVKNAENIYF